MTRVFAFATDRLELDMSLSTSGGTRMSFCLRCELSEYVKGDFEPAVVMIQAALLIWAACYQSMF